MSQSTNHRSTSPMATYGKPKPVNPQPNSASSVAQGNPVTSAVPPNDADSGDWVNVHAGAPEKWSPENVGDALSGVYVGFEDIEIVDRETGQDKTIRYYDVRDGLGHTWSVPNSYQIEKAFEGGSVKVGDMIRLTYTGEIDLNKPGRNPMKNYQLDVKR